VLPAAEEEVKACVRLDVAAAVPPPEQLVDHVALVEEALSLGEEVPQPIEAAPDMAADEAGLEVLRQYLLHHRLRPGMSLEDRQVALE
jgi:hypothetical protein